MPHQQIGDASVTHDHRNVHRRLPVTICDAGVGAGSQQLLDPLNVAACHRTVEQRVTEGALIVRVSKDDLLVLHTTSCHGLSLSKRPPRQETVQGKISQRIAAPV
jgi:hypothetical protein